MLVQPVKKKNCRIFPMEQASEFYPWRLYRTGNANNFVFNFMPLHSKFIKSVGAESEFRSFNEFRINHQTLTLGI